MSARRLVALVPLIPLLGSVPAPARGQVLRELAPIDLEYAIYWGDPKQEVGEAVVSFHPVDTKRGRRLEIHATISYALPRETLFTYEEESTLLCDEEGLESFNTSARALGKERINVGLRSGDEFHVTTTFAGKKRDNRITADVRRTNFGFFAGAFLDEPLDKGDVLRDYPLLFPVGADHQGRQKYREAILPFTFAGGRKKVHAIRSRVKRPNEKSDYLWNTVEGHQILLRMEESSNLGEMTYELRSVNGVAPAESELIR